MPAVMSRAVAWVGGLVAFVGAPLSAQAQTQDFCGRSLRVESAEGVAQLVGAGVRPITMGEGTTTFEAVNSPRGGALVVRVTDAAHEPRHGVVLHCAGGRSLTVVWQGATRWQGEDLGARTREEVLVRDLDGDRQPDVAVVRRHEARVCGLGRPILGAHRVDLATGRLTPAEVAPLADAEVHAAAERALVTPGSGSRSLFALRRVLTPTREGTVEPVTSVADGDVATVWMASRGAFLSAALPSSAFELRGIELFAPRAPRVMPRRWGLYLDPGGRHYSVEIPATGALGSAGTSVRVALPGPVRASCLALVPEDATTVSALADFTVRSALDDGGEDALRGLVAEADGADGDPAARLLVEMGARGAVALAGSIASMTTVGARRAVGLLARAREPAVIAALVAALAREDVADAAAEALLRNGAAALEALSAVVATNARASAVVADFSLPVTARLRALVPALHAEGEAWQRARAAFAALLVEAARERRTEEWAGLIPDDPKAASRALRVTAESLALDDPAVPAITARARALWAVHTEFEHRYRVIPALAGDDEGREILAGVIRLSDDADLRAEAARALGRNPASTSVVLEALGDRVPHVRATAARALRGHPSAVESLTTRIHEDPWPSVRVAVVESLAHEPRAVEAVTSRLEDPSYAVVRATITALGVSPGGAEVSRELMAFAENGRHAPDLRRDAVDALGVRCDPSVAAGLDRLAESLSDPALPPYEQEIAQGAMAALARVDPARARAFLTRNQSNAEAAAAVERAVRQGCSRAQGR